MGKQGQEEIQLSILLLYSVYEFLNWQQTRSKKHIWFSAISAATTLLFRPTALTIPLGIAGIYLYQLHAYKKNIKAKKINYLHLITVFSITSFCALAIVFGYNFFKTGNPLKAGYSGSEVFNGNWLNGIFEPIFGLDRGIIWTNIWLLPCFIFTCLAWKYLERNLKILSVLCLFLFSSSIIIYCKWFSWAGDFTYGARFQVHLVPLLCLTLGTATIKHFKTLYSKKIRNIPFKLLSLLVGFILFLLQLPSIAFNFNLEIYQAISSNTSNKSDNGSPTGAIGQIQLRYQNFFSKLTTNKVVAIEGNNLSSPLPPGTLKDASRWDFWPWMTEKRVSSKLTIWLKFVWIMIVLASFICWIYAFQMLAAKN